MPWKETCPVDERVRFVAEWMKGERTMVELARAFNVSRKTAYKWLERYDGSGPKGLVDASRRPTTSPFATSPAVVEVIIAVKKARPSWGPRKIRDWLRKNRKDVITPAASTIGGILGRRGLVTRRARRRYPNGHPRAQPFGDAVAPNDLWCADFKGHFRVGRFTCYPLTIGDAVSRFLLRAEGLTKPRTAPVKKIFQSAFRQYGLPTAIRTDNGPPFASRGPGGMTKLSAWWVTLGIRVERIKPGNPQENGRLERLHRTLKLETASPPRSDLVAQQESFDEFRRVYNEERPHEALGGSTPSEVFEASARSYDPEMDFRDIEYPEGVEVRRVGKNGRAEFEGRQIFVGRALAHQLIGLKHLRAGIWSLEFGPIQLGSVDLRQRGKSRKRIVKVSPMSPV
ncbi:MAG TPA: IS481 family transposase [Candidatus Paceibacterota bacterium]|nr:IS481 family transposase [Candidatus Paceibacterota bacterium]